MTGVAMDRKSGAVMLLSPITLAGKTPVHQQLLPCKLNSYLAFVEGGQC
jgi:hypothetical protein